ncbi:ABC transporter permease [Cellulosimicrobium arenosum]|uniref:ABC3 transporter permease protein domain-containing protein n=1 Tax=Cellulosimicrobium arenosum TaxID=2708133 RepID=A0A927G883_9MICO|nr:ABC transporter permease [Cellulosimicrobium arenosum]MBD8078135.1 hypothetical protein [Cellulosimicrobium arenosum]
MVARRRARAHGGLLLTILLLAAAIVATVGATIGSVQVAATDGSRAALTSVGPTASAVQVRTRLADDPQEQDARVRSTLEADLADAPLEIDRVVRTEPLPLSTTPEGSQRDDEPGDERAVVASDPRIDDVAELVEGSWPQAAGETALQADAAAALGLTPGDDVVVGAGVDEVDQAGATGATDDVSGTSLTVVGTWRPADPAAPRWFDDPLVLGGVDGSTVGPFVVDEATLATIDTAPFAVWTVVPDADRIESADLSVLADGAEELRDDLRGDEAVAVRGLTVTGDLATTARDAHAALRAADAVTLVPVGLLVVVSLVALVQVARLLAQNRAGDAALLVARGAAVRQVTALAAVESAVVVGLGAVLGVAAARLVLGLVIAPGSAGAPMATSVLVAVASAVVGSVLMTAVAWWQARGIARRVRADSGDRSGRVRSAAALGTVVVVVAVALLCAWQLRRYGSPVVVVGATTQADPLAVLAPAAVLTAAALVATAAVLGPAAALVERLASRRRGIQPVLAARQVARRVVVVAVPVVLVVLASGAATLAGAYAGTTASSRAAVDELRAGTDVRVVTGGGATVTQTENPPVVARYAALDGARGATSVLRSSGVLGEDPVALLALDAEAAPDVLRLPVGMSADDVTGDLRDPSADLGAALPDGATGMSVDVTAAVSLTEEVTPDLPWYWDDVHHARTARVAAWVADESGALHRVSLGSLSLGYVDDVAADVGQTPSSHAMSGDLPGPGAWRFVGLDLEIGTPLPGARATVTLDAASARTPAGAEPLDLAGTTGAAWVPVDTLVRDELADLAPSGPAGVDATFSARGLPLDVRLAPEADATAPVPVTLPAALADSYDLAPGDESVLTVSGTDVPVRVQHVVEVVPGAVEQTAVLADLATWLQHGLRVAQAVPRPDAVWIGTDDDLAARAQVADEAAGLAATQASATDEGVAQAAGGDAGPDAAAPVRVAFWLAAAGAVVLALAGVLAVALSQLRARRAEVAVLRALGTLPGVQARGRAFELAAVGALALVLGVVAGWAVAALTVPALARATLGSAAQVLPVPLVQAVGPTAVVLVALTAGLAAVVLVVAARVRAQALDAHYREEIR